MARCNASLFNLCSSDIGYEAGFTRSAAAPPPPRRIRAVLSSFGSRPRGWSAVLPAHINASSDGSNQVKQPYSVIQHVRCDVCGQWLPPPLFPESELCKTLSSCRKCKENAWGSRLMQASANDVDNVRMWRIRMTQRRIEQLLLQACHKFGVYEEVICQQIFDFFRIPFLATDAVQYCCEVCGQTLEVNRVDEHLRSKQHCLRIEPIISGRTRLINDVAIELSERLGETPPAAMSRLRSGLGLGGRICEPGDLERAARLKRLRDVKIPKRMLQDMLPQKRNLLWITPEELSKLESVYKGINISNAWKDQPKTMPWFESTPSSRVERKLKAFRNKLGW